MTSLPGSHAASQLLNADHRAGSGCEGVAILYTHFLRESYSYCNLSLGEQFHLDGKKDIDGPNSATQEVLGKGLQLRSGILGGLLSG